MAEQAQFWSVNGLATEFKLDRRMVAKRIERISPVKQDGRAKYWFISDVAEALLIGDRPAGSMVELEEKKLAAEVDIAEMKAGQMRADLIPANEVGAQLDRAVAAVRARLLAVPGKLAPIVRPDDPALARRVIEAAMLEVLEEMQAISLDDADGPESETAA